MRRQDFEQKENFLDYLEKKESKEEVLKLSDQVVKTLREKNLFIATVESCTGGGLVDSITNISGASEVMKESFITYSNEAKIKLGIPAKTIDQYTVYSLEVAEAMAEAGLKAAVRAEVGVGITGSISRVDPSNPNSQPGVVYIGVKFGDKTISRKFVFADKGERWEIKEKVIIEALKMILKIIE